MVPKVTEKHYIYIQTLAHINNIHLYSFLGHAKLIEKHLKYSKQIGQIRFDSGVSMKYTTGSKQCLSVRGDKDN